MSLHNHRHMNAHKSRQHGTNSSFAHAWKTAHSLQSGTLYDARVVTENGQHPWACVIIHTRVTICTDMCQLSHVATKTTPSIVPIRSVLCARSESTTRSRDLIQNTGAPTMCNGIHVIYVKYTWTTTVYVVHVCALRVGDSRNSPRNCANRVSAENRNCAALYDYKFAPM